MKIKLALLTAALLALASIARAQTDTNTPPPSSGFFNDLVNDLGAITNWSAAPYITYAPNAPTKVGGGALLLYNLNNYVGAGPGIDWLGDFNLVSANVTLQVPTHPFAFLGASNIVATPFVLAGIATPIGGAGTANGNVASIQGLGLNLDLLHIKSLQLGLGYEFSNWTGAGDFSGRHHHVFLALHTKF